MAQNLEALLAEDISPRSGTGSGYSSKGKRGWMENNGDDDGVKAGTKSGAPPALDFQSHGTGQQTLEARVAASLVYSLA